MSHDETKRKVLVEAGARPDGEDLDGGDGAPPTPCLSMKNPDDPR